MIGLRNGRATLSGSENLRPTSRIGFPECFGVDSTPARARLLGLLSQWDPTGRLCAPHPPPPGPSGPLDFGPLTSPALSVPKRHKFFSLWKSADCATPGRTDVFSLGRALI